MHYYKVSGFQVKLLDQFTCWKNVLECSPYFFYNAPKMFYNVVQFQILSYNTSWVMNFFPVRFLDQFTCWLEKMFLECNQYFSRMHLKVFYNVVQFQIPSYNTFRVMNFFPVRFLYGQTQSDAYEPTVQSAQVGSKRVIDRKAQHVETTTDYRHRQRLWTGYHF